MLDWRELLDRVREKMKKERLYNEAVRQMERLPKKAKERGCQLVMKEKCGEVWERERME